MDTLKKREHLLYAAVWLLVFTLVPLSMSIHLLVGDNAQVTWQDILPQWKSILPYLCLFLLHNYLITPFLYKKKWGWYLFCTVLLLGLFGYYCLSLSSTPPARPPGFEGGEPFPFSDDHRPAPPGNHRPIDPNIMRAIIGLLVVLVNLGFKALFQNFKQEREMKELEAQQLSQQLETLRYQINPHFFMNTLNNIHALVDIDPEKAKESIEEFSKLMRIVLYDGNSPTIPLQQEIEYLKHYVSLMRLRYPQDVDIRLDVPAKTRDIQVPPLIMATFVENAFKHGISYNDLSFIHIFITLENDELLFKCSNSIHSRPDKEKHGLGVENIRKRLNLQYRDRYSLHLVEAAGIYEVFLKLPIQ